MLEVMFASFCFSKWFKSKTVSIEVCVYKSAHVLLIFSKPA